MSYFSIDCEASGPAAPLYNLLSIGATEVHLEGDAHVLGPSFYVELQPIFPGMSAEALEVCGLDVQRLAREGVEPREAMERLTEWVRKENRPPGRPVFVGHNAVFDWAYIAYYYLHFRLENPFGYKGIDTKSLAMGVLGVSWQDTSKENLVARLGIPPQHAETLHRADADARHQADLFRALVDRIPKP